MRNPTTDHLLTPENSALIMIDYQPSLIDGTHSIDRDILVNNAVAMAKVGVMYDMPIVLSTIAVRSGYQQDTIPEVADVLRGVPTVDRDAVNAWEEPEFRAAVERTGRRKLIMAALWTEVCLAYPALDALREGYEVYAVSDVSGGTTVDAHERGMQRLIQAGAVPVTWEAVMAELGRLNKDGYDMADFVAIMNEHLPASVPA
ncbi:MAG: isochorismatase family protein [Actinomycetota bacterium]